MLSVSGISDFDQLLIELVNRARTDPAAEAATYGIGLNDGLSPGTISPTPKPPLAPHQALATATGLYSDDMLARNFFSHQDPEGLWPWDRVQAIGYPTSAGVGENIAWRTFGGANEQAVSGLHEQLFRSSGHRQNMLNPSWNEVGTGVTFGLTPYQSVGAANIDVAIATENFGGRSGVAYLTGIAFDDADTDGFYDVGEGLGGVTITATDGQSNVYSTSSANAGGYALELPSGSFTVTASGGGVFTQIDVTIGASNVKRDFQPSDPAPTRAILAGRADDGNWWVAVSDGESLVSEVWGHWSNSVEWLDVRVGDFNGDGRDDIAGRTNGEWWLARSTGNGFITELWARWSNAVVWKDVVAADFDGDGRDDIAGRANGQWWVSRDDGNNVLTQYWGSWSNSVTWDDVMAADVDGNGRSDIIGRTSGQWWVARSQATYFTVDYWGRWSNSVTWTDVMVADVDGNGQDDVVGRTNGQWWVARSQGLYFRVEYWGRWSNSVSWNDVMVGDVDGDGYDDVVGRANGQWWVSRSTGVNFLIEYWGSWSDSVSWSDVTVVDVDGDGRDDILGRENGRWWAARSIDGAFVTEYWGVWSTVLSWDDVRVGQFS